MGAKSSYAIRLQLTDDWQTANRDILLDATRRAGCRLSDTVAVLRVLASAARPDGTVAESVGQIAQRTAISERVVKRCLDALSAAGAIATVRRGRRTSGGTGMPAVRHLRYLDPSAVGPAIPTKSRPIQAVAGPSDAGDEGPDVSDEGPDQSDDGPLVAHTSVPSSETPSDTTPAPARTHSTMSTMTGEGISKAWQKSFARAVADAWWALDESNGRTAYVRNKNAVLAKKCRDAQPHIDDLLSRYGAALYRLDPSSAGWADAITIAVCQCVQEPFSFATAHNLAEALSSLPQEVSVPDARID